MIGDLHILSLAQFMDCLVLIHYLISQNLKHIDSWAKVVHFPQHNWDKSPKDVTA